MSRTLRCLAVLLCLVPGPARASVPADGTYAVVVQWPPHSPWQRFALSLQGQAGTLHLGGREPALTVARAGDTLDLRWPARSGEGHLHGDLADDHGVTTFSGTFTQGPNSAPFQAIRVATARANDDALRDGEYRISASRSIFLARSSEIGGARMVFDSDTGRIGVLTPVSESVEVLGATVGSLLPIAARFSFAPPDSTGAETLALQYGDEPVLHAQRMPYRSEEVTFHNGAVTLRGTLMIPPGSGTHPAIVLVHAAGPQRRPLGLYPYALMHLGFAVLAFDKRGAGESTGDYRTASYPDLAGDVVAGIDAIKENPAVDPHRIGIFASSNGGWVAPVVATQSHDVAFIVCRVCSMLTVAQNQLYERETEERDAGVGAADVARAVALHDAYTSAVVSNTGWDALRARIAAAKNADWFENAGVPDEVPPDPAARAAQAAQLAFDPAPYWKRVKVPVLFLFAENDGYVKTTASAPLAARYMHDAGNAGAKIVVLPHADHGFLESATGLPSETQRATRFAGGFIEALSAWTSEHRLALAR